MLAAFLKGQQLAGGSFRGDFLLASPWLQVVSIQTEILLGCWLLSGIAPRASWIATLAFFVAMSSMSAVIAVQGQATCDCLGAIPVSPWLMTVVDGAIVLLLLVLRPPLRGPLRKARWSRQFGRLALTSGVMFVAITSVFLAVNHDPLQAFARMRGEALIVSPALTRVGAGVVGEQRSISVRVQNISDRSITVISGDRSCNCLTLGKLPLRLAPQESCGLELRMFYKGELGDFQHHVRFSTDDPLHPNFVVWFSGEVVAADSLQACLANSPQKAVVDGR